MLALAGRSVVSQRLRAWLHALLAAALSAAALAVLHHELRDVHYRDLIRAVAELPRARLLWAIAVTLASYAVLTGYDVLATVRRRYPQTPVLLMSGYTEHTRGAGGEEPDGFLEKPFTARALDALIDQIMRAAEMARSNNGNHSAG